MATLEELEKRIEALEKIVSKLTKKKNSTAKDGDVEKIKRYKKEFLEKLNEDISGWNPIDFVFYYSWYRNNTYKTSPDVILVGKELWQRNGKMLLVLEYFKQVTERKDADDYRYKKLTKWYIKYIIDVVKYKNEVMPYYIMCSNWALNEYSKKLNEFIRLENLK